MENELFKYGSFNGYTYYDVTLSEDYDDELKAGTYFECVNFNRARGTLELMDTDANILYTIKLRWEIVSIERNS